MAANYEVLPGYRRFNQKHNAIMRSSWDPKLASYDPRNVRSIKEHIQREDAGFDHLDFALSNGATTVASSLGTAINRPNSGITSWESLAKQWGRTFPIEADRLEPGDPDRMREALGKVARFYGADLVGFTPLDMRWVYSHHYDPRTGRNDPVEIPEGCDQVIVMGVSMDRDMFATAPTAIMMAETQRNYSILASLAGSMAEFIRTLGYRAVPCMNDTALSVPLAVDAGLAQPSRLGPAITPQFGPRVRFCKVITDLPLNAVKKSADFGVIEFCEACERCAQACPAKSLPLGPRTTEANNISNNPGVLKWYGNYESCRLYWSHLGTNCGICIRVCPFNHGKGFHHAIAKRLIRLKWRWVNRLLVRLHGWLGYGRQKDPRRFWNGAG
ncbi:MAG: reductive dehalogenase [Candidatus Tectomicrobia bacterium]|uniref:Reductive dehalogenase n=1 Tax=Tectimicrobiota bacterium TaxID=2528274 RepID=A0A932MR20_UNCTE|nr:reductive dehalogenase [Candidatus Tectomicrobia bacterium]